MRVIPIFIFVLCLLSCGKEVIIEEEPLPSNPTPVVVIPTDCEVLPVNEVPDILQCTLDMCYQNARIEAGEVCTQAETIVHYGITIYYNTCFHNLTINKDGQVLKDVILDCE